MLCHTQCTYPRNLNMNRSLFSPLSALIFFLLLQTSACPSPSEPTPNPNPQWLDAIHVAADSKASKPDGQSWATAYSNMVDALASAAAIRKSEAGKVITIVVKEGTYQPASQANALIDLSNLGSVELLGGFAGQSESLADQDPKRFETTVLSGEVAGSSGSPTYLPHVVLAEYESTATIEAQLVIRGFTITKGKGSTFGGGLSANNARGASTDKPGILLESITFTDNNAALGGGMAILDSIVSIRNVIFDGNSATSSSNGNVTAQGGAIYTHFSTLVVEGGRITNNSSVYGGVVSNFSASDKKATFINVVFTGNMAKTERINTYGLGEAIFNSGPLEVKGVSISNNSAANGGAVFNDRRATLVLSTQDKSLFVGNIPDQQESGFQGLFNSPGGTLDIQP
jgi:hypothetical protein